MKRKILLIISLFLLLGFGSHVSYKKIIVFAEDNIRTIREETENIRDTRTETNTSEQSQNTDLLRENRDTEGVREDRNTEDVRDDRDTEGPRDRDSIKCDPKFGGDPKLCITPTPSNGENPTPGVTSTPTPGPVGGPNPTSDNNNDTTDHNSPGTPPEGPKGSPGQVLGLSYTGSNSTIELTFLLLGLVCILSGFKLIRASEKV